MVSYEFKKMASYGLIIIYKHQVFTEGPEVMSMYFNIQTSQEKQPIFKKGSRESLKVHDHPGTASEKN